MPKFIIHLTKSSSHVHPEGGWGAWQAGICGDTGSACIVRFPRKPRIHGMQEVGNKRGRLLTFLTFEAAVARARFINEAARRGELEVADAHAQ